MPFREYEAKVFVENTYELTKKFQQLDATLLKRVIQTDCYYDLEFKLTKKDQLLRLRTEKATDTQQFSYGEFSWKSGRKGTQYEVRRDISIPITTEDALKSFDAILNKLGFRKLATLLKHRDRWLLKDIEFEFDQNIEAEAINRPKKNIGSYLQATIETEQNYSPKEMDKLLWTALEELGFNRTQLCWKSYMELYLTQIHDLKKLQSIRKREI